MVDVSEGFTTGPWWYQEKSDAYTHIVRAGKNEFIVQLGQDRSGKAEANARLIAAAPDMHAEIARLRTELAGQSELWGAALDRCRELADRLAALRREKDALMEVIKTIASLDNEDLYYAHVGGRPTNTATQLALAALRSAAETKDCADG